MGERSASDAHDAPAGYPCFCYTLQCGWQGLTVLLLCDASHTIGPMFTSQRDRKDAREQEREQLRLEKRHLRDLRWAIERSTIEASDWADLLTLQQAHGKEGPLQLFRELIPYWRDCQRINGGADIPTELFPQATGLFPRGAAGDAPGVAASVASRAPATRQKAGKGAPRKRRSDAGKAQPSRKRSS